MREFCNLFISREISAIFHSHLFWFPLFFFTTNFIFYNVGNTQETRKDYALFIAITDYIEWPDLRNPISDAETIAKELETEYGFDTEIVRNANKQDILKTFKKYRKKEYNKDDQLYIFLSGHGEYVEESWQGFFIPQDASKNDEYYESYIAHSSLEREISSIPCRHILIAIDACFSGTFDKDIALFKSSKLRSRPGENARTERIKFVTRQLKHKSRLYITSGGKERTPDGTKFSPFTEGLLRTLRTYGGTDEILTFTELVSGMETVNPTPYSGEFEGNEPGGSFIFDANGKQITQHTTKYNISESYHSGRYGLWERRFDYLVLAKIGDYTRAIELAKKSKELAILENQLDFVKYAEDFIGVWSQKR